MIKYQGTLTDCRIPLTEQVLLHFGKNLHSALTCMHNAGYCHLDVKPANIFLRDGDCFLGDYGAATRIGHDIHERTVSYYPHDAAYVAEIETDMLMLAVTLLQLFGRIASPVTQAMARVEIMTAIELVDNDNVNGFLQSLFS
jgi:serine/threonine protein kinase